MRGLERFTGGSSAQKYGKHRQLLDGGRSINVPVGRNKDPTRMRVVDYWISLIAAILGQVFRRNFIIQFSGTSLLKCSVNERAG